ncbi:MAG: hypothetical protein JOZ47_11190 [Kutzneria sp.]|nr:hypothetical protein [Kutzneria sp.]MBV9845626.1 hypothetical protein [Kutzneria sp.]
MSALLAAASRRGATVVNVGHGRMGESAASARAFVEAWPGDIGVVVSWPAVAASWLRPARRLASGAPDLWVVADDPQGWSRMGRRLASVPGWDAARTLAFSGLAAPRLPALAGFDATEGLCGVTGDGLPWTYRDGELVTWTP